MTVKKAKALKVPVKHKTQKIETKPKLRAAPSQRRGYGGRSAEELRAERRERLIAAGLDLFATRGYHRTQIELLCTQARVTTRHYYEEFANREALLLAVYEMVISQTRAAVLRELQDPALTPQRHISMAIRAFVHAYTSDPRYARIACIEVVGVSEEMARQRRKVIHEFALVVEAYANQLAKNGTLPVRNYHLPAVAMIGAVNELVSEWLIVDKPPSVIGLTDEILKLFDAVIGGAQLLMQVQDSSIGDVEIV